MMKRKITGLIVLLVITMSVVNAQSIGQDVESDTVLLDDIIIEENRIRIPFSESTRSLNLVLKQDLERQPVQSIGEALVYIPGVDVRNRGVSGVQSDLSIRGSTFDENLVLINGVKMTDPQTGHHLMNLPINFQDIQRIEVLKGGAARVYGQNAYSGAVNIITKIPDEPKILLSAYGALGPQDSRDIDTTFYGYGLSVGVALPTEVYSQYISYGRNYSNGHRYNSDYDMHNLFYQSSLTIGNGEINLQAGYNWRDFGANGFYYLNNEREKVETGVVSMEYQTAGDNLFFNTKYYFRRNKDNYVLTLKNPSAYNNVHLTNSIGTESNFSYESDLGITGFGVELRYESIEGLEHEQLANNDLLDDDSRINAGFFGEHRFETGRFSATPGIYINYHSDYDWSAFPGMDFGIDVNDHMLLYGNFGRTYRVPTFYDLHYYSDKASTYGDPNLDPGVANNYELGFKYNDRGLKFELAGFYIDGKTTIDWVYDPNNPDVSWQARNFDNVDKTGIEAGISMDFNKMGYEVLEFISVNYTYINSELQDDQFKSLYATSNLKHQLNLIGTYSITDRLKNTITAKYRSRPDVSSEELQSGIERFQDYVLLDIKFFYEIPRLGQVFLEGTNLLDKEYVEVGTVTMPGRWYRMGFQFDIGL